MYDDKQIEEAIEYVLNDEELLKKGVLFALKEAHDEHKEAKGVTSTTSTTTNWFFGALATGVKLVKSIEPVNNMLTTESYQRRLTNSRRIRRQVESKEISAMDGLFQMGQEGHWYIGDSFFSSSFNAKAFPKFIGFCVEKKFGSIGNIKKDEIWKDDSFGLILESKRIYQEFKRKKINIPNIEINQNVGPYSLDCADLLIALSSKKYETIFTKAIEEVGRQTRLEFKTRCKGTYNYNERLSNTDRIISDLTFRKIDSITAYSFAS